MRALDGLCRVAQTSFRVGMAAKSFLSSFLKRSDVFEWWRRSHADVWWTSDREDSQRVNMATGHLRVCVSSVVNRIASDIQHRPRSGVYVKHGACAWQPPGRHTVTSARSRLPPLAVKICHDSMALTIELRLESMARWHHSTIEFLEVVPAFFISASTCYLKCVKMRQACSAPHKSIACSSSRCLIRD